MTERKRSRRSYRVHRGAIPAVDGRRVLWIAGLLCAWTVIVVGRLFYLQVLDRGESLEKARKQHERTVRIEAHRGRILDRVGRPLAESVEVPSLYAHPNALKDPGRAARQLAPLLGARPAELTRLLSSRRNFVWLGRRMAPALAGEVHALNLAGVAELTESRRYYPGGRLAAQVLGFVGLDGEGLGGVEYTYDHFVSGRPGRMISVRDGRGNDLLLYLEHPSSSGQDLRLTLDQVIQYHAEVELDRAMKRTGSSWGSVVIMAPLTGAVLAMATRPSFNPNAYQDSPASHHRNRPVTDPYEPGSTLKVFVAAEALERELVRPGEILDCGRGKILVSGKRIRDHKEFDRLTFADVIAESSNVGTIVVGLRIEGEHLYDALREFGFGARTDVGLPGESAGILHAPKRWSGVSQASISIGQEIGVTAMQLVRAISAVASGGVLPQPHILEDAGGRIPAGPRRGRRVISRATAETLNAMLERTVDHGTGKLAAVHGYRVAGKTGTAQKPDPAGGYGSDHVASFLGYAPSRRPALAMLVVLDSPQGRYHGGEVAAPVFARIATPVLRYLGIPPDEGSVVVEPEEAPGPVMAWDPELSARPLEEDEPRPLVPDVRGASLRAALATLAGAGLAAEVAGTGRVVQQSPSAGAAAGRGDVVKLILERDRGAGGASAGASRR